VKTKKKERAPHRILGIDPGGHVAGWGLVRQEGNKLSLEDCGTLRPGSGIEFPERLRRLHEAMGEVLDRMQPEAVAIESVFFARHPKAALQLGHVRGVLLLAAASRSLPIFEYPPATVKKAVTGHGAAKKEQVRDMVNVLLGTRVEGATDKSDALAIAICHAHSGGFLSRLKELDPGPKRRRAPKAVASRSPARKAKS